MDVTPEIKLRRFLHYASEKNIYEPGDRVPLRSYDRFKVTCISELLKEQRTHFIIDTLKKVIQEKSSLYPEAVLFILVHCLFDEKATISFKNEIYLLAEKATQSPENLMAFVHFLKWHSNPYKFKTGRGVKRLIKNWYLSNDRTPLDLAEIVTLTPTHRGFTHKDLIRLAHVSSKEPARDAVLLYSLVGLEAAKTRYRDSEDAQDVLAYLEEVDGFRRSSNIEFIARKIESYSLTVRHICSNLLKHKEIWTSLLRQITINDLMDYFQIISKNKLFRNVRDWDAEFVRTVCDTMGNPSSVRDSRIHPSRVFLELYKYKNLAKLKVEMGNRPLMPPAAPPLGFRPKVPPLLNSEIVSGLSKLLRASFKNLTPSKKRYLIAVEGHEYMKETRCGHSIYVTPMYAAALISQVLVKVGKKVEIVLCSSNAAAPFEPMTNIQEFDFILSGFNGAEKGYADVMKLIQYARQQDKKVDAFVVLGSYIRLPSYNMITEELKKYDSASKVPNSKLILCSLRGHSSKKAAPSDHPRAMIINGFDDKVCNLIETFIRGCF